MNAPPMPQSPATGPLNDTGGIRELPVSGMYLLDKNGEEVFYPDMTYEKLVELVNQAADRRPDQPPDIFVRSVEISGQTHQEHAVLDVRMEVTSRRSGWRPVQLRFSNAVLQQPDGDGKAQHPFIVFDEKSAGHICWVEMAEDESVTLQFRLLAPLVFANGQTTLSLDAPRAATDLTLDVAGSPIAARIEGAASNRLVETRVGQNVTKLIVKGGGGDLRLSWGQPGVAQQSSAAILESVGKISATIEDPRHVRYDAELTVSSFGGEFRSFRVRLPPAVELLPSNQANYRVSPTEAGEADAARGKVVELIPSAPGQGPLTVRLRAATPRRSSTADSAPAEPEADGNAPPLELAGFEVLEAVRQRGRIDVAVEGDWSLSLHPDDDIQSDDAPAGPAGQGASYAGFLFYMQPFSLTADVRKKTARINVDPTYVFDVQNNQVKLRAVLKCRSRGPGPKELQIDLQDWKLDRVTPHDAVDFDAQVDPESNRLVLPLPTSPDLTTAGFEAHLDMQPEANRLEFSPPQIVDVSLEQPTITSAAGATLIVVPAESVQLTPLADELQALTTEPLSVQQSQLIDSLGLGSRQQPPLAYRQRIEMGPSLFAADFRVKPRRISVTVRSQLEVGSTATRVEQVLQYRITRGAVDKLELSIPRALASAGADDVLNAEILIDGRPAQAVIVESDAPSAVSDRAAADVELPVAVQGDVEMTVRFVQPWDEPVGGRQQSVAVALIHPREREDVVVTDHELRMTAIDDVSVRLADDEWRPVPPDNAGGENGRLLIARAAGLADQATLTIAPGAAERSTATVVRRAWVQTWLTGARRRDRAVFALDVGMKQIQIEMPPGAESGLMDVAVNGRRAPHRFGENPQIVQIDLGDQPDGDLCVVELVYHFQAKRPASHNLSLELPQVLGAAAVDHTYWQLVTPDREHLLTGPAQLTPELTWQWRGAFWDRQASMTQRELEQWSGAEVQPDLQLPEETNKYLFSALGPVPHIEIWTVSRWAVVLAASIAVLLFALVFMRQPALRRGEVLLASGVLFIAVAVLHAEAALLLAEAAVLGVAAAVLGALLRWFFAARHQAGAVVHGKTYSSSDSNVVDVLPMHPEGGSQATTATAPVSSPVVEAESKA